MAVSKRLDNKPLIPSDFTTSKPAQINMALSAIPSPSRADPALQPSYFTSSLFVEPLRNDINVLIIRFHEEWSNDESLSPFSTFKVIWSSQGWQYLHLKVFDDRGRERFLHVTCRLFLEGAKKSEAPLTRVAAIFGLYTFYSTQPRDTTPPLWYLDHIPIPIDQYDDLRRITDSLATPQLKALLPCVAYILDNFVGNDVFLFLPKADASPQNPRTLPREIYAGQPSIVALDSQTVKKKGRPSKNDKARKIKATIDDMEKWLQNIGTFVEDGPSDARLPVTIPLITSMDEYQHHKSELMTSIDPLPSLEASEGRTAITRASHLVMERLKEAKALLQCDASISASGDDIAGIERVENAIEDMNRGSGKGILGLLEGSGIR